MLTHTNPPLPPFPWLEHSEPALPSTYSVSRKTLKNARSPQLRAGIGAGFAVLCGGTALLLLWPFAQPVPVVDVVGPAQTAVTAVAPASVETSAANSAANSAAQVVVPPPIMPAAAPPATITKAPSRTAIAAPLVGPSPAAGKTIATDAAPIVASPAPPAADTPASADTIAEFRSVVEESRDAARLVIRLASRQRPPRNASAEELDRYRLWQQSADAARDYRRYLDTLSRSMRRSPSQAVSQQLLERARQTQAYLTTMLEKSQAAKN